jgi:hypothetical protein
MVVLSAGGRHDFTRLVAHTPVGYPDYRRIGLTANLVSRHKVFISYYHEEDQEYKDRLVQALDSKFVDKSVSPGDIHDQNLPLDEIRRRHSRPEPSLGRNSPENPR